MQIWKLFEANRRLEVCDVAHDNGRAAPRGGEWQHCIGGPPPPPSYKVPSGVRYEGAGGGCSNGARDLVKALC